MRFGKEETSTEDKKPCLQGFVPSWSFLTRQRFLLEKQKKMLYRTCKFAAVHRPLCSFPETPEASPMRGSCRRRRLMRWTASRQCSCLHLIRHGFAVPPSPHRGRHWECARTPGSPFRGAVSRRLTERLSQICDKTQTANSVCGLERKK